MKKYGMVVGILLLCLAAVVHLAAEPSDENAQQVFAEMTAGMNLLAEQVAQMESPEDFIEACNCYADTVEEYGKRMYALMKAHPEWGENPPPELAETLAEYGEALMDYDPALNAITSYANDHTENEAVQSAMKRLNTAVYSMYK
ncbi:MAG: hypothetical protein ACOC7X_12780 [Spirochaetota bacterium]